MKVGGMDCVSNHALIKHWEELAQQLLGERYDGVYDFFCDVLEDASTYKILRARRCQVLFELFLQIILLKEEIEVKGEFLSSNAIEKYMDALCDDSASVLIVDDVLIHGRGMKQLYEQFDSNYSRNSIRIMVYCRALSATYIDEKLDERFCKNYLPVFDYEWRSISCCFVDLIIASVIPYESFAGSLKRFTQFSINEAKEDFNQYLNLESERANAYILFEKKPLPVFFKTVGYDTCLRIYTSRELNVTSYVPYVLTKSISFSGIPRLLDFVCKNLDNNRFSHIISTLLVNDEKLYAYQMRLFSAIVNRIYGVYLLERYSILNEVEPNRVNMKLCFGQDVAEEILSIRYEDISALLDKCPPYDVGSVQEDAELEAHLKIYDQDENNIYRFLSMYYFINGQYDEECAQKRLIRRAGLSVGCFYEKANSSLRHAMTAAQLKCWDYGQASGVMKADKGGTIALYGVAGEQNFRFIIRENIDFFRKLATKYSLSFIDTTKKWDTSDIDKILNSAEDVNDLPEGMECFNVQNKRLLKEFLRNNSSSIVEWFIPQVLS